MFTRYRIMAPEGETASGSLGNTDANVFEGGDVNETFDDMDYESEASKKTGETFKEKFKDRIDRAKKAKESVEDLEDDEKPKAKAKKEEPKSKKGSDIDLLPDSEEGLDDKDEKPKKSEKKLDDKKETDEEDEELSEEKKQEAKDKAEAKKLKIRMADGLYGIESDAKVRVKIDGDFQEVPIQELINNYSGKTAWDKKFTEIGNEKKQIETLKSEVHGTKEFLSKTVSDLVNKLDDVNGDPYDALTFLVEKAGRDPYTVWKRALEANLDTVENLMSMSESERKAFFLEKKDEFRTKSETAREEAYKEEMSKQQYLQKVDSLRQAHGVSEEQYLQALDELESEGQDTSKISDEALVDYASLKPHVSDVQDVLEPYQDSIDDSKYSVIVRDLAKQLRANDFTKEQLIEWARKEFLDEDLKDLQMRAKPVSRSTTRETVKAPERIETLDDWD